MTTETFNVAGMTCGGCVKTVTRSLSAVAGVHDVSVSLATSKATVDYDERLSSLDQLKAAVIAAGYAVDAAPGNQVQARKGCC